MVDKEISTLWLLFQVADGYLRLIDYYQALDSHTLRICQNLTNSSARSVHTTLTCICSAREEENGNQMYFSNF